MAKREFLNFYNFRKKYLYFPEFRQLHQLKLSTMSHYYIIMLFSMILERDY